MRERILGAVFLSTLLSLGVLAYFDETQIEGNKKPSISERSITVSASTEAKQQQADSSIKP